MELIKLTTVNIKELSREDLEQAYKLLLKISLQKTELINAMKYGTCDDIKKLADSAIKPLPA